MNTLTRFFCSLSIALFFAGSAFSQTLDTVRIDNKLSILNDRAFFTFPTHATNVKRGVDIMSADPNENEETRIVLDLGEMRLVFFAEELYLFGEKDMLHAISAQYKGNFETKILTDKDSLQSYLITPQEFDSTKNAILVNSLVVRTPDNTLFRINAYINPQAYSKRKEFQALTAKVFKTLSPGTRRNNLNQRGENIAISQAKTLSFNLPKDYVITTDQQYDFQVIKLHHFHTISDTNWRSFLIYLGNHPSMVYRDHGLSEMKAERVAGTFLGNKVDWLVFNIKEEGMIDKEQKIPIDQVGKGLLAHIAMMSNDEAAINEMTRITETIQLQK